MDYLHIINYYYHEDTPLRRLLLHHSRQVADRCLLIASRHPELRLDAAFLETAAMLHDIGICRCQAPSICCNGTEPYIRHGLIGAEMLRTLPPSVAGPSGDMEPFARVCERHTGTGLTRQQIESRQLPLPPRDFVPQTLEEQVVCYADKFYSKSHPERQLSVSQAARALEKFGREGVEKFLHWSEMFE